MATYDIPPGRQESKFDDKLPLLIAAEATAEAMRCLYCHDAPCIKSCPTAIDIPTFIRKIGTGNLRGAARTILSANLLGDSCARVCPVEVLCESTCVYVQWKRPAISIGQLQRYAMQHGKAGDLLESRQPTGHSVGLVGAGPASLACAGTLALLGHEAVIYEKAAWPGGLNATGIAPYKLKLEACLAEVEFIRGLGVEIHTGVEVGTDLSVEQLFAEHGALFLGPGLGSDSKLGIPGEEGPGVVGGVQWIRELKTDPSMSMDGIRRAVVVGGGNTAIDVVRELCGLGIGSVTLVYRRSREEMPGYEHELSAALRDGVRFIQRATVVEVLRESGAKDRRLTGVRLVEAEAGRPTDRELGLFPADLLVVAIGQTRLRNLVQQLEGVQCDDDGRIVVDPVSLVTLNRRIFAGGDARNGGKEVVHAVHDGQVAARSIDTMLREE